MTDRPTQDSLTDAVALFERALSYTLGSLHLVTPEAMYRPTPCSEWDLARLLAHMDDSLAALHEAVSAGRIDLDPVDGDGRPQDPVAAVRDRSCRLIGEWARTRGAGAVSVGGCPLATGVVAGTGAVELAVHGWDVARGCGTRRDIPAPLAEELLDLVPELVTAVDRPGRFAAPLAVVPGAGPGDRLLAFLGREPG